MEINEKLPNLKKDDQSKSIKFGRQNAPLLKLSQWGELAVWDETKPCCSEKSINCYIMILPFYFYTL